MPTYTIDENTPLIVEFSPQPGLQQVSLSPADVLEKSTQALDSAMSAIYHMAGRVSSTMDAMVDRPNKCEVEFGLKLQMESGAIISKVGGEGSITVKLTWEQDGNQ